MAHQRWRKAADQASDYGAIAAESCMVVRAGDEIFVSGQTGIGLADGRVAGLDRTAAAAVAQADTALTNLKTVLEEAGSSLGDICKITVYIDDRAHRIPVYQTLGRHLRGIHPVSTGLIVRGFARPELLFALDVAAVSQRGGPHLRLRKYHTDQTRYGNEWQPLGCDFCMAIRAGSRVYLRGQTGQNLEDRLLVKGDAGEQAAQAMRNVEALLGEAGAGLADIGRLVLYVTDRAYLAPARDAVLRHIVGVPCAMSEIVVKGLANPDLLMEVDTFAVRS
jgi:enamine deaminase RidA (YjgF/YER057c/UK114 family)